MNDVDTVPPPSSANTASLFPLTPNSANPSTPYSEGSGIIPQLQLVRYHLTRVC